MYLYFIILLNMLPYNSNYIKILNELVPIIHTYYNSIFVIKYGGAAMKDLDFIEGFIHDILLLHSLGIKPVIIHGGGPLINDWLSRLDIIPKFHNGLRVTDRQTMEVVEMVLCGKVNKFLVSLFNRNNAIAVGLSGKDAKLITCQSLFPHSDNFVAEVKNINIDILRLLLSSKYIPIISSTSCDDKGDTYNINADSVAGAIASYLKAEKLFLLTDTPGIMHDLYDNSSLIQEIDCDQVDILKKSGVIQGGMVPKVDSCVSALHQGVKHAYILDGRSKHSILYELFTNEKKGTRITL